MKKLVFDSSSLISLSEKCFMKILGRLAEKQKVEFFMPYSVMKETVEIPLKIKRFELNAIRIKTAIKNGWIKVIKPQNGTLELSNRIMELSKGLCLAASKPLDIIHKGEIEALALVKTMGADALVIDERTTRMLLEEPRNLLKLFEYRTGKHMSFNERKLVEIQGLLSGTTIFRSSEIIALGYEKDCFENELENNKASLKAALFSVKYAGCAISEVEITEYLKGIK